MPLRLTGVRTVALALCALVMTAACSDNGADSGSTNGGFASYVGVLGCADQVLWGTVAGSGTNNRALAVRLDVAEWIYPSTGSEQVVVVADDPNRQVGAPEWTDDEKVLVVVSSVSPPAAYNVADGETAVRQWRDAGSPRTSREQCGRA